MLRGLSKLLVGCGVALAPALANAATLRVPADYPTIQQAVDAAKDGDRIRVSRGSHCGATITKRLELVGRGSPRIIGCDTSPQVTTGLRAGFFLPGNKGVNPASGTSIRGFRFDGRGVSNANLAPLSFGVFARFASDVRVSHNRFDGTVQAITNTGGDRWQIEHNRIRGLTLLDCTTHCTGGDGIVIALARGAVAAPGGNAEPLNRPENNVVARNEISGTPPDNFGVFSMVGVLLLSADHTTVLSNRLELLDNPSAAAVGQGIVVSNSCCGLAAAFLPGSRFSRVAFNDGRKSEVAVIVEGAAGANTEGLFLWKNRGKVVVEGSELLSLAARRVLAPPRAQPTL
jgi:nitrous oxidase accessory protein NosD